MKVKNFAKLQHFKDRSPPWVKLYRDILDQRDINLISDCSFRVLVGLWLLASEDKKMQGNLPSIDDIAFRLRMDKAKIINALKELAPFLENDDISVISERYQDDVPETETEIETEREREKEKPQAAERAPRSSISKPDGVDGQVWSDWLAHRKAKKAPVTQTALDGIAREAAKANVSLQTALQTMCERGWQGFKAEWLQNVSGKAAAASVRRSETFDGFLGEPDDKNVIDSIAKWVQ